MNLTEEQLAICYVYANCWKIPPVFRKDYYKKSGIDFEWSMPDDLDNYDNFQSGIFEVLSTIVSEDWKASEWRRMMAMRDDYWPDAEKRLFPLHMMPTGV